MFEFTVLTKSTAAQEQARRIYADRFSFTPMDSVSENHDHTMTSFAVIAPEKVFVPTSSQFASTFWSQIDASAQEATVDVCSQLPVGPCNVYQFFPEADQVYNEAVALQSALNAAGIEAEVRISMLDSGI